MTEDTKRKFSLAEIVFILFIVMSTVTGVGYYIYCIGHGIIQYTTYPESIMSGAGRIASLIRYSKDILMIFLFGIVLIQTFPVVDKFFVYFIMFVAYGAIIGLFNGLSFAHIFAGVRCFIYFVTGLLFFRFYSIDKKMLDVIYKITIALLCVQVASVLMQVVISGTNNIGNGSYRYIGLFLHTGTLGNYAYAIAIFLAVFHLISKKFNLIRIFVEQCLCLLISIASNSRLCIAGVLVNMIILLMSKMKVRKRAKELVTFSTVILFLPLILTEVLNKSGRGGLEASASGKFSFWSQAFSRDIINVIVGNGLGYATQTTATLGINTSGYSGFDGTFSVIMAQFGVLGLVVFAMVLLAIVIKILKCPGVAETAFKCNIVGGLLIFTWSGNIFENILLVTYYLLVYYMLRNSDELEEGYCGKNKMD